ncbi:MAG: hypothetical protein EA360_00905 [Balneolaceae bacterium]|nr:MAG: hypothetical protein EA360_00905 [Balneolaceae bacterium]
MKSKLRLLVLPALFCFIFFNTSSAQSIELFGSNIVNGAVTGTAVGAAVMGLKNDRDITPLRIGLGTGILAGTAIAIYDLAILPQGQSFFISGVFNDGENSSIIILLDTFYGALAGVGIGSAIVLINNSSFLKGIQYGASAGALGGLAFGIADSFFIAEKNRDFIAQSRQINSSFINLDYGHTQIGLLRPGLHQIPDLSGNSFGSAVEPVLNLVTFRSRF